MAVLFIGTLMLASGLILAFANYEKGRKVGMYLIAAGLFVFLVCFLFYPRNNPNYHL